MKFQITGRNINLTESLKAQVEKKLGKLSRYFSPETIANVTLSVQKDIQTIEVTIPVKGGLIRAEEGSSDMYVSIDLVQEIIERQIRRHRKKLIDRTQGAESFSKLFTEEESADEEDEIRIVKIKKFDFKTPGREDDDTETKLFTKADVNARKAAAKGGDSDGAPVVDALSQTIARALGSKKNITAVDCCATRLRCSVADSSLVNDALLKATGAVGVIKKGTGVQVVYGPQVAVIKANLETYLETAPDVEAEEEAPMQAPEPQTITATEEAPEAAPANPENPAEKTYFNSPFTGELHPITDAPDEAFAGKMTGDGFFVYPTENTVYAPADGEVTFVFDTKHAIGMTTADGVEYLLHIGIDTVKLNGQGFTVFVEDGQEVKQGDKLMEFDDEFIKQNAPSDACLCIFTDMDAIPEVHTVTTGQVKALDKAVWF